MARIAKSIAGVSAAQIGVGGVIESVAVCIRCQEREPAGESLVQFYQQGVIPRIAVVVTLLRCVLEVRIRPARADVVKGCARKCLVEVDERVQAMARRTAVAGFEGHVFGHNPLYRKIPLFQARCV